MSKRLTRAEHILLASLLMLGASFSGSGMAQAFDGYSASALRWVASESNRITEQEIEMRIQHSIHRVPEFKFLQEEAKKRGISVYLFGGTASSFAHYVRWDLMREMGVKNLQKDRFDYDLTRIIRSNQDLDIVVDGNSQQIAELQALLQKRFPMFQGNKTAWEVRSLREDNGPKTALLNSYEFANQNTDSHSTGMIDLTLNSSHVVRDLRDWSSSQPQFLKDITQGRIHYYFSSQHENTAMAKAGENPPILSVLRLLAKASQFDLEIGPEDRVLIQRVINNYEPGSVQNSYALSRINSTGIKIMQNAVNLEKTYYLLQVLRLKEKLIKTSLTPESDKGSLAWWANKEPLKGFEVGRGQGATAQSLGISRVAHATTDFAAYESITRSHGGEANVFISRNDHVGEVAAYGDGFYSASGDFGKGENYHVRFDVMPEAREGTDFKQVETGILILNKKALRIVPEKTAGDLPAALSLWQSTPVDEKAQKNILLRQLRLMFSSVSDAEVLKLFSTQSNTLINLYYTPDNGLQEVWSRPGVWEQLVLTDLNIHGIDTSKLIEEMNKGLSLERSETLIEIVAPRFLSGLLWRISQLLAEKGGYYAAYAKPNFYINISRAHHYSTPELQVNTITAEPGYEKNPLLMFLLSKIVAVDIVQLQRTDFLTFKNDKEFLGKMINEYAGARLSDKQRAALDATIAQYRKIGGDEKLIAQQIPDDTKSELKVLQQFIDEGKVAPVNVRHSLAGKIFRVFSKEAVDLALDALERELKLGYRHHHYSTMELSLSKIAADGTKNELARLNALEPLFLNYFPKSVPPPAKINQSFFGKLISKFEKPAEVIEDSGPMTLEKMSMLRERELPTYEATLAGIWLEAKKEMPKRTTSLIDGRKAQIAGPTCSAIFN